MVARPLDGRMQLDRVSTAPTRFLHNGADKYTIGDMSTVPAPETFRTRLRDLCRLMGVSQRELARRAGLTHAHVNRIFRGTCEPSLTVCESLSKAVGQDLGDMLCERTQKISRPA